MRKNTILIIGLILLHLTAVACQMSPLEFFSALDHRAKGEAAFEDGDYDLALSEFTKAIKAEPEDSTLFYARGSVYYERYNSAYAAGDPAADGEDFDRAITDFTRAIELDPQYAEAYNYRGLTYAGFGMNEHALADYNMAIDLNPLLPTPYYGRGYLYEITGKNTLAIVDYNRFLDLSDDPYWRAEAQKRLTELSEK